MKFLNKYVIGLFMALGLIIIILVLSSNSHNTKPIKVTPDTFPNAYLNDNSSVELYVRGPIVAESNHYEESISVNSKSVNIIIYKGYNGQVYSSSTYANTQNSYNSFLRALNTAFYARGVSNSKYTQPSGYCPTNYLYYFRIYSSGSLVQNNWRTNCSGYPKTFDGNSSAIVNLYKSQVPDYGTFINNIPLDI